MTADSPMMTMVMPTTTGRANGRGNTTGPQETRGHRDAADPVASDQVDGNKEAEEDETDEELAPRPMLRDCLDTADPIAALVTLAEEARRRALQKSHVVSQKVAALSSSAGTITAVDGTSSSTPASRSSRDVVLSGATAAAASTDSIWHSLERIASGGSQASTEIRALETTKQQLEHHATAIHAALVFRQRARQAAAARHAKQYAAAAAALQPWLDYVEAHPHSVSMNRPTATAANNKEDSDDNASLTRAYTGEASWAQLTSTHHDLQHEVLQVYQDAVATSDLQALSQLTPVLARIRLTAQAVALYVQYLQQQVLPAQLDQAIQNHSGGGNDSSANGPPPPHGKKDPVFAPMARAYNIAVSTLRHHLPLVSHCLYDADGDVAVVQLVHVQTQERIVPLIQQYQQQRQWAVVSAAADRVAGILTQRWSVRSATTSDDVDDDNDNTGDDRTARDAGFARSVGRLRDVDTSLEEAALCIQHAESYLRFVQYTCAQVQQARVVRFQQARRTRLRERERDAWNGGSTSTRRRGASDDHDDDDIEKDEELRGYQPVEILPPFTRLHQIIAELGGQYASVEHGLLLASMQRTLTAAAQQSDPNYTLPVVSQKQKSLPASSTTAAAASQYKALNLGSGDGDGGANKSDASSYEGGGTRSSSNAVVSSSAMQTTLVETCWYAARRAAQRALATGHTGTAAATTNYTVDCLQTVLLPLLSRRADELGVSKLKPGGGLLVGATGIFNNASNLIRQTGNVGGGGASGQADEIARRNKRLRGIAMACATINDLEVAVYQTEQLEKILLAAVERGFPPQTHETEQLLMCVRSLTSVAEGFRTAADATVESLASVLKPRLRSIVSECVGGDGAHDLPTAATSFMRVGVGGKSSDEAMVRMNYQLDSEAYDMLQLGEGYIPRLCHQLDDLLSPMRPYLAPRLWDLLFVNVMGTIVKRLETSLRKCAFTALGALALDTDARDLLHYTKERLYHADWQASNAVVGKACPPLGRLLQIARLLNVDDLEDVLDLIASAKRKGQWELKGDDTRAFLCMRVDFDQEKVQTLLNLPDGM